MSSLSRSDLVISPASFRVDRGLLDQLPGLVRFDNVNGHLVYANAAWMDFTGHVLSEEVGLGWIQAIYPADRDNYLATYRQARDRRRTFETEYRLRRRDGSYRWILERVQPYWGEDRTLNGFLALCIDTTDRREADGIRREIEEQVRVLGLATRDWVWSWDGRTDRVLHNTSFTESLGDVPGPREATIQWWQQRVHPTDLSRVLQTFSAAVQAGASDATSEYRFRKVDGSYAVIEDRACFLRDTRGAVIRVLGAMRDITQRKRVEDAHARFGKILESTSDFVAMTSAGGLILYVNAAGRDLIQWPTDRHMAGVHLTRIYPPWAAEIVFEEGIPWAVSHGTWTGETALMTTDGREIPVSQVIISHHNTHGDLEFLSTIIRDISAQKREETARIEWANRYDAAIRASGQVLFDWNSITNEITYGGDLTQLLGFTTAEMMGGLERFRELIHPEDLIAFDEEVLRVTSTRDPFRLGIRVLNKLGAIVHIEIKGYFFIDRLGQIGRMVGFLADVTLQRQAEEELERAHEGLEARVAERTAEVALATRVIQERALQSEVVAQLGQRALAGIELSDLLSETARQVKDTLRVDMVSVLELTADGAQLMSVAESGWPDATPFPVALGKASQSGYTLLVGSPVIVEDLAMELRFQPSPAAVSAGVVSGISVPIESGGHRLGVLTAMTTVKRAFTQGDVNFLQSTANVLSAAIDRKRSEERIRAAQAQAEAANRAKSEFLSRISHELRTPLNAILGFTQLLEIDQPTPTQAESITHISRAGQHLLQLINEVLDIARIETGRLSMISEPVELGTFLRETTDLIRPAAERQQIDIRLQIGALESEVVSVDRQRLKQVVMNLLSNAVKYNRAHGSVVVAGHRRANVVRISVTDTGPGIATEKIDRLFVPFERLGAESMGVEGTGLGLSLCHRIITALGGEIGVESTVGEGSTFWFQLPCNSAPLEELEPAPEAPLPLAQPASTIRRRILYIEDQDLNLRLVERIFSNRLGYELIAAMQGSLGIDLAREHRPDLILLDINLPDLSGEEVLRRLKASEEMQSIPVIMVSADVLGDRGSELIAQGAAACLTKPYKLHEFFGVIEQALAIGAASARKDS